MSFIAKRTFFSYMYERLYSNEINPPVGGRKYFLTIKCNTIFDVHDSKNAMPDCSDRRFEIFSLERYTRNDAVPKP